MNLTPTLNNPKDLYEKMVREGSRAVMTVNNTSRVDHFYNFCISALSLRDHVYEYLEITDPQEKLLLRKKWGCSEVVQAAHDIANSAKHFILRDPRTNIERKTNTKRVTIESANLTFTSIGAGGRPVNQAVKVIDIVVELENGNSYDLFQFILGVCSYWEEIFPIEGIKFKKLTGSNSLPIAT